jgi:short-subunit dehydrogenase
MGRVAIVTGASEGLGAALAENLAGRGYDLVLAARSSERLQAVAADLSGRFGVKVWAEPIDLAVRGAAQTLAARIDDLGVAPEILVNNAGAGYVGAFIDQNEEALRSLMSLNVVALTELTHIFARRMAALSGGRILLVASVSAFGPSPHAAVYAASKAYVLSLGEALNVELAPKVTTTVLSPGLMDTRMIAEAGLKIPDAARVMVLDTSKVARIGLDALFAGRPSVVAGRVNKLVIRVGGLFSRGFRARHLNNAKQARS